MFGFCFGIWHLVSASSHFHVVGKREYVPINRCVHNFQEMPCPPTPSSFSLLWQIAMREDLYHIFCRFRKTYSALWIKFTAGIATVSSREKVEVFHESDLVFQLSNRHRVLKSFITMFHISTSVP